MEPRSTSPGAWLPLGPALSCPSWGCQCPSTGEGQGQQERVAGASGGTSGNGAG